MDDLLLTKFITLERRLARLETLESGAGVTYAEGSWTPAFAGSTTAGAFTYTVQVGRYTRIGNVCFILGHVGISAIGTAPAGDMYVTGLPFTSANITNLRGGVALVRVHQIALGGLFEMMADIVENETRIRLLGSVSNSAAIQFAAAQFDNPNAALELVGHYQL